MDIFTLPSLDNSLLPDTALVDAPPLDTALNPLPDMTTINSLSTDFTLPTVDNSLGLDWYQTQTDWNQPALDWNQPALDWTPQQQDWSQSTSLVQDYHEHTVMPRSPAEAAKASEWADWHQANADKATEWAKWDAEHNPENFTRHTKEAAEEQAKADAKRQEALNELNK